MQMMVLKSFFSGLLNSHLSSCNSASLNEDVRVFGNPCHGKLSASEKFAIKDLLGVTVSQCVCYHHFTVKGILYHSSSNRNL